MTTTVDKSMFTIQIDGEDPPGFSYVSGGSLVAWVYPRDKWLDTPDSIVEAMIYVFRIPVAEYVDLETRIDELKDTKVTMGDIPSLLVYGKNVEVLLESDCYYDVICVSRRADGTGGMAGGTRYSTAKGEGEFESEDESLYVLAFDATKLLALSSVGLTIKQGEKVTARIVPMTAWGTNPPGRLIIAGFDFGKPKSRPWSNKHRGYMVSVHHMGGPDLYGHNPADIRKYLGF